MGFVLLLTSVGGGFLSIGLDLHAASDAGVRLSSGQIGNVNESVVEGSLDVAHAKDVGSVLVAGLAWLGVGGTIVDDLILLNVGITLLLCFGL